jgi:hypothetical protein
LLRSVQTALSLPANPFGKVIQPWIKFGAGLRRL